jgi:parvulin-like peptidyl-prolyl isomerase
VIDALKKMESQILLGAMMTDYLKNAITDEAIKGAYAKNPQTSFALRVIVLNDAATAKSVIKALKGGKSFGDLAQEKSLDKESGKNGGALPTLVEGQLPPVYTEALKKMKSGAFSEEPLSVMGKWHVLYLDGKQKATFEQSQAILKDLVSKEKIQTFIRDLKKKSEVKIYDPSGNVSDEVSPIFADASAK